MKAIYSTIILITFFFTTLSATTYYVDEANGNNTNLGITSSLAWKSISKVNSTILLPGDQVLFKTGNVWREQLNLSSSGSSLLPIIIGSYGTGNKPIISGADILTGFTLHSGSIWKKNIGSKPQQVFFNDVRGREKTSTSSVTALRDWYYNSSSKILYVYSTNSPSGVEATVRNYTIYVNAKNYIIKDLQVEKTDHNGISLTTIAGGITIDNLDFLQWTNAETSARAGIVIQGKNNSVRNCTFGKNTGNDVADQNWAGYVSILVNGSDTEIENNKIYHSSTENENPSGSFAYGIRVNSAGGMNKIFNNYIYHTASHGISIRTYTKSGDQILIYGNTIEYPGQAGISLYQTRGSDGVGGKGYIYKNNISFANRLGGYFGPNQASGIHFNDGVRAGTELNKPFIKWYCYENIVHDNQAVMLPNSQDASGISMDFNANNVEVYRNLVYNNNGKGIYMWNANGCKIYYNIVYGNDCGTLIAAAADGIESADNNMIYNNTYFKNYNGDAKGPNVNAEIYFGQNGKNNIFKNNILYGSISGFVYLYNVTNTSGHILNNNLIYTEREFIASDAKYGRQTFAQWKANHPTWDDHSIYANPGFNNQAAGDFSLKSNSPAINKGAVLEFTTDFDGNSLSGVPDIGAREYIIKDLTSPEIKSINPIDVITLKINFSEEINFSDLQSINNYSISSDINILSATSDANGTSVTLTTSKHDAGSYTLTVINLRDLAGNLINTSKNSKSYSFTTEPLLPNPVGSTVILLNAIDGTLSGDALFGTKEGSKNNKVVYFPGTKGGVTFSVNIPKTETWYAWARMYYMRSGGGANSFFIKVNNGTKEVLGTSKDRYDKWYWDGYNDDKVNLGTLKAGMNTVMISGREPGTTLWIDQLVLTTNPDFVPDDNSLAGNTMLLNAMDGTLSGDAHLGSKFGMKNINTVYFPGTKGGVTFNVNIPETGTWYAWARMYYMRSGGSNSFFIKVNNGAKQVLGTSKDRYDKWYWDGYNDEKINLGILNAGTNTIMISGREPGTTLWVDQIVLTTDPDYNPNNALEKENSNETADTEAVPTEFEISQNYPNPFNPSTTIKFTVPENSHVSLKVFDMLGSEVAELVNEVKSTGYYEIKFDASSLSSGIYIYQIRTNNLVLSKKMNLLK